ncbi:MAG: Sua5/YciO/YrdC/YwlC family protein, partial [Proteobacteria bacterium]|nr:Sua5/YciO/YrdC/YwlC family protein [Pseudomonadota bacterium]
MLDITRCRFTITGQVQGVGFRPFIYRTALEHELTGNVRNAPEGVVIEIQGTTKAAEAFASALAHKLPPLARIVSQQREDMAPVEDEKVFEILHSTSGKGHSVLISPDIATCPDCLEEILQPQDRRYRYPFTNCTNCGPRYTITRSIPYDRPVTSMSCFPMCPECQAEYDNPLDRRFHAQPNACPVCGPQVWLSGPDGARLSEGATALESLAGRLAAGEIAAIKGLGGFHLACDARNEAAVSELRRRKNRPAKPLAVMVPNVDATRGLALISEPEAEWLNGMFRPIVLCAKRPGQQLAPSIAPDTNFIGLMLPYTPLHHVLLALLAQTTNAEPPALVMTSGNLSSEPICLGNREALARLPEICDVFCFHNRDILIR